MAKYIVSYDNNIDFSVLETSLSNVGCTIVQHFSKLSVLVVESLTTEFSSIEGILNHEIETDIIVTEQWHLNRICSTQLPMRNVYVSKNKGAGTTIYLMDSGVDSTHPELSNANIENLWSWDGDFTDTNGHGTGLASVIVGTTLGVVPETTLKSVKIPFGQSLSVSTLLNAFDIILNDHLLTPSIKVVNCSWNIPKSLILDSKIVELQEKGLVVVAAAGNSMIDANTLSPVGLNTILGVGACDAYDRVISWGNGAGSNWGEDVDITAPGIDVNVAVLGGGISQKSGTSIASAIVAGVVCQYILENPSVTSSGVIQDIVINAAKIDLLFRNETIYGTTPNRIVYIPYIELMASPSQENRIIEIQKGTTVNIPVTLVTPATTMNIHNFYIGSILRTSPDWITLEGNTITISPPSTIENGNYVLEVQILDANNNHIGYTHITLKVYTEFPFELNDNQFYTYHRVDETGTVIVVQSVCGGGCSTNGSCTYISKSCICAFNSCAQT